MKRIIKTTMILTILVATFLSGAAITYLVINGGNL